ncbi:TfuA-like protein [Radicibacter daui]|uniref:TfuA-like protein n=1 Tax=Radicibacter daui TaxID=3064829 RepID=UPI004046AA63
MSDLQTVVFLGPSLSLDAARALLPQADFRPPVAMGDVLAACEAGARRIALIDGFFENRPAVFHKEILFALSAGCRVYGASSMGALRAAELAAFGMEGVGAVYAAFADGTLEDDDEVAVTHAPGEFGFRPVSEAMVNIRATIAAAIEAAVLAPQEAAGIIHTAKELSYKERQWKALESLFPPAFAVWFAAHGPVDVKGADARQLLMLLAATAVSDPERDEASEPAFLFQHTVYFERARDEARGRNGQMPSG